MQPYLAQFEMTYDFEGYQQMARSRTLEAVMKTLAFLLFTTVPSTALAQGSPSAAVHTTPHFVFYSDISPNVHDALIAVATARRAKQPDPFSADEQACFRSLPAAERGAWDRAVDDYVAATSTNRQRLYERLSLAGLVRADGVNDVVDREFLRQWNALRDSATPAYRRCRWPAQDAANRRWIDHVKTLLAVHEATLGERLPRLFATGWAGLPFRVDVVDVAGFGGANSASADGPTLHVLVSSTNPSNQGPAALETVFHEASHFLTTPDSPLGTALRNATARGGATMPPDIVHEVHFFITGEAVRRAYADRGETYTPYVFALRLFSDAFRENVARAFLPQIDGNRTVDQAADDLVRAMTGR
jgi:hypothetical protein